ncbi:MAG TPA: hypothetical protein PLI65_05335 [Bacteroidales bacterium]|nr:hypothetical protein [Bacteroidales bacterium]HPR58286.1 hypothetical protein [Bacteroidales bacterium]HRW96915.1 hypothetical protein [Bacteroidales bacterium]
MEKENKSEQSVKPEKKNILPKILIGITIILTIIISGAIILSGISARKWVSGFNQKYYNDTLELKLPPPKIMSDPAFIRIQKSIAFTKSRLELTRVKPTGLSMDLKDSIVSIEINGVTVHSSKISKIIIPRTLRSVQPYFLSLELSKPLQIAHSFSTIAKEPIIVKTAPKDSTQVGQAHVPDTSNNMPVYFQLAFTNGFRLSVFQEDSPNESCPISRMMFSTRIAFKELSAQLKNLIKFKIPDYQPEIVIFLPASEAKTIYRAIPENGFIAFKLF